MSDLGKIGGQLNPDLISPVNSNSQSGTYSQSQSSVSSTDTLDEPVSTTILRDVKRVGVKLRHVLIPSDTARELRDWDLWGPLILCLLLAISLSVSSASQTALVFAAVFVIVWVGAGIITLNAALLGGNISFLQSVCVLGYCIAPLNLASLLCHVVPNMKWLQILIVGIAFIWSTRASVGFMAQLVAPNRRALGVYPVLLFYLTIGWMILVQ